MESMDGEPWQSAAASPPVPAPGRDMNQPAPRPLGTDAANGVAAHQTSEQRDHYAWVLTYSPGSSSCGAMPPACSASNTVNAIAMS